jgi:DNA-binding XRE family transcriptional regulator
LTQIAVCKKIGFSCQFYGKIEKGEVPCPEKALKKLVKLLRLQRTEVQKIFLSAAKEDTLNLYTP